MFIDAKSDISMDLFRLQRKLVFLYSKTFYIVPSNISFS